MNLDQAFQELSARLADQLRAQMEPLLEEAQATIGRLESELNEERARHAQTGSQLSALQQQHQAMLEELQRERDGRDAAAQELETIHAVIAAQVERAEAEHEAEQTAEAERERRWSEQVDALQAALGQERSCREALQARVETLRAAAAALFAEDLPLPEGSGSAMAFPVTVSDLLANAAPSGLQGSPAAGSGA